MLQSVEILPSSRRSLRRDVRCEVELIAAPWSAPRLHRVTNLSPDGMSVAAGTRLPADESLVVSFTPPGWWLLGELTLFARVARSQERRGDEPATMGLSFLDMPVGAHAQLARALRGRPPPLPRARPRRRRELVWVDTLVTYTEDLGDRVNTFEVSEAIRAIDDEDGLDEALLAPRSLCALLTGSRTPYRWAHQLAASISA